MLTLKTNINITPSDWRINYQDNILSIGSCFAQNIAQKLQGFFYNIEANPFGIIYNPVSIRNSLALLLNEYEFDKEDLFEHKGIWNSFQHHSTFSGTDSALVLSNINQKLQQARQQLSRTNVLIITLGTAWAYELKRTKRVVSNCHKIPANKFNRIRLTVEDIITDMSGLLSYLKEKSPQLQVLFTVSPIRHIKDGMTENQISKSTLLLAVHELTSSFDFMHYFPAYEIMIDDLRDYRFYNRDLIHPNDLAVDYIWQLFEENYLSPKDKTLRKQLYKIRNALSHRPFFPATEAHQKFVQKQLELLQRIQNKAPQLNLEKAIIHFKQQLT